MKKSGMSGRITSAKVSSITSIGLFMTIDGKDYFLSYKDFPWFTDARVSDVLNVSTLGRNSLRWESLDVDLEMESLLSPEKYPLKAKQFEIA